MTHVPYVGFLDTFQSTTEGPFEDLDQAIAIFEKKFKEKAGAAYADRASYIAKAKKYSYKAVQYGEAPEEGVMWQVPTLVHRVPTPLTHCPFIPQHMRM